MKKTIFAAGADMKNRFLFARGPDLYPGSDTGDLSDARNYERFKKEAALLARRISAGPEIVACDLHPDYFSTKFAKQGHKWFAKSHRLIQVQHHHAHIASVVFEHNLKGPVIGVSFDGTGYGTDGNIWGGEFLLVKGHGFERLAYLKYRMMPGGDKVVSQPWRMVLSVLGKQGSGLVKGVPAKDKELVLMMMEKGINSPLTSSAGRLFDAAAALLGICINASYEAEGPIKLESMCREDVRESYGFKTIKNDDRYVIDTKGLFLGMVNDIKKGEKEEVIATRFHNSMAEIIIKTVKGLSKRLDIKSVAISGGVFQNLFLRRKVIKELDQAGFDVCTNSSIPVNDLNIATGQYHVSCLSGKN